MKDLAMWPFDSDVPFIEGIAGSDPAVPSIVTTSDPEHGCSGHNKFPLYCREPTLDTLSPTRHPGSFDTSMAYIGGPPLYIAP